MVRVEETDFVLQGRTEPVAADTGNATRFTAFAFGIPNMVNIVEVSQTANRG